MSGSHMSNRAKKKGQPTVSPVVEVPPILILSEEEKAVLARETLASMIFPYDFTSMRDMYDCAMMLLGPLLIGGKKPELALALLKCTTPWGNA